MSTITKTEPSIKNGRAMSTHVRRKGIVSPQSLMNVEQWAELPDVKPPYELIGGKLIQKMVTTNEHDWATSKFWRMCDEWADTSNWRFFSQGSGARFGPHDAFIPDVMGFPPDAKLDAKGTYNAPPFIAVEVLSRGTKSLDRREKKATYARAGVAIYVIIDTEKRAMEVHHLNDRAYAAAQVLMQGDVWQPSEMPGLKVELNRLWF